MTEMVNLLTIDVEDWFHTSALEPYIDAERWDSLESRVVANVRKILAILEEYRLRGTFFILGWVAERHPGLVKEIDTAGHEIGSHGYRHRLIYNLSPSQFEDYLSRSKRLLEDLCGRAVQGYRATSFSIVPKTLWALDSIRQAGFVYDSSIFPVGRHDIYGLAGAPRFPFVCDNGLMELPPSTLRLAGRNLPVGGGGYFRLYPYWLTRHAIRSINREGFPALVYLHPWELDPDCPRVEKADGRTRFRQYFNLTKTESRLRRLLGEFRFGTAGDYVRTAPPDLPRLHPAFLGDEKKII